MRAIRLPQEGWGAVASLWPPAIGHTPQCYGSSRSQASTQLNSPSAAAHVHVTEMVKGQLHTTFHHPGFVMLSPWAKGGRGGPRAVTPQAIAANPTGAYLHAAPSLPLLFLFPRQLPVADWLQKQPGPMHCFVPPEDYSAAKVARFARKQRSDKTHSISCM